MPMTGKVQLTKEKKSHRGVSDFVGIGLSVLCLIHCLTLPLLITFAPAILRRLPGDDITHRGLAVAIGLVGVLAFRSGYRMHRRRWLLILFVVGLALVSVAAILGDEVLTGYGEGAITVCGGLLIVTAHLVNHSFCQSCVVRNCSPACSSGEGGTSASSAGSEPL
jgi:peptidoglycan/LPS O-acetylase OafA/YrhL